jgi:Fur family transcriptional regulator, ferric uptake regulator
MSENQRPVEARQTKQRAALADLLRAVSGFHTAQEWHQLLLDRGTVVGLATIYRSLQAMVESGEVDTVRTPDGQAAYRVCSTGHHHHLICRQCGRTVEVELPDFEAWAMRAADIHGFADIDHALELFGVCTFCQASGSR